MTDLVLKSYQLEALNFIMRNKKSALLLPTGCLSGDTIIRINRGKNGNKIRIDRLYKQYYDRGLLGGIRFDLNITTYVRSYCDGEIRLNKMIDVMYSGKKAVFELVLCDGTKIKATPDHKILTTDGFVELANLSGSHFVVYHKDLYYGNFGVKPVNKKVKSVKYVGVVDTYDIQCESPNNNFVANNIVVHNSGKTLVAMLYLRVLDCRALIITQASIKHVWHDQNTKFDLKLNMTFDYSSPGKIFVTSYDWIKLYPEVINEYEVVIMDEALCVKDSETMRYKSIEEKLRVVDRVVLLAGYPVENKLEELYVLSLVTPVLGKNYYHFLYRHFTVIKDGKRIIKAIPKPGAMKRILDSVRGIVYITDKSNVVSDSVKREYVVMRYDLSQYQLNMIEALKDGYSYSDDKVGFLSCKNSLSVFSKVMQIISGFVYVKGDSGVNESSEDNDGDTKPVYFDENPKFDLLCKIVDGKSNFLLWYFFNAEEQMIKKYKNACRICKLQVDSRGNNFQEYKFSVYFSLPLSGGVFQQSLDRQHRIGRTEDIVYIILLPSGPIGDKLFDIVINKQKLTKKVVDNLLGKE